MAHFYPVKTKIERKFCPHPCKYKETSDKEFPIILYPNKSRGEQYLCELSEKCAYIDELNLLTFLRPKPDIPHKRPPR